MAGSSRSTPFPVPVYIYRSFYRSKIYRYQYRYRYRYSGFRGFSVLKLIWFNSRNNCSTGDWVKNRSTCLSVMTLICDLSRINSWERIHVSGLDGLDSSANRNFQIACMKIDRPDSINHLQQSALTSPGLDFLPTLHYPSIYWWHYVMVSIIQPWTWDRGLLWLTLSFFIYITAKPVGYIYPKEISINTVKFFIPNDCTFGLFRYSSVAHAWLAACAARVRHAWAGSLPLAAAARRAVWPSPEESKCAIVWYKNLTVLIEISFGYM